MKIQNQSTHGWRGPLLCSILSFLHTYSYKLMSKKMDIHVRISVKMCTPIQLYIHSLCAFVLQRVAACCSVLQRVAACSIRPSVEIRIYVHLYIHNYTSTHITHTTSAVIVTEQIGIHVHLYIHNYISTHITYTTSAVMVTGDVWKFWLVGSIKL